LRQGLQVASSKPGQDGEGHQEGGLNTIHSATRKTSLPARICGSVLLCSLCLTPAALGAQPLNPKKEARKHLAKASELATKGKREEALKALERVFKFDVANTVAHRLYQDLMIAAGRRKQMLARYARAKAKKKNRRLLQLMRYMEARAQTDASKRREELEGLFKLNPRNFWVAYDLVAACVESGDLAAAEKYAGIARDLKPRDADVRNVLGNVLLQAGKLDEAEKELKEAIKLRAAFAEAHYNMGLLRAAQKKYAEAVACFKQAGEFKKDFAAAHNNRGHCLARLSKLDEAIAAYKLSVKIKPDYGSAWNNMSVAYYRKKDYWNAWGCLQKAEKHGHVPHEVYKRILKKKLFPEKKEKKPAPVKK
jgi:tetratricopeptide (TPR) repeat protein